ncbi:3-phosphoshikimate 1-carboxyvinyltransferase [Paenibacillus sp. GYB004]|uniref:3-phosphoshikimate 1-carboxyvinyltransferase n=1 Tax=Paenibacillus sp. GYB004 TaxID=2994393 RepID=UPI002F96C7C5
MNHTDGDMEARSPWSGLQGAAEAELHPPVGAVHQPEWIVAGSKSVTNRVFLMAAMADGSSVIGNALRSDDTYWCLNALRRLGVKADTTGEDIRIEGTGGVWPNRKAALYAGAAGTVARFLPGLLAGDEGGLWRMEGSRSLRERPIAPLVTALRAMGAEIRYADEEGKLPIEIAGKRLRGGAVSLSGSVSSQFLSGVLIASPYAAEETKIVVPDGIVQHAYVRITIELMERFGVPVTHGDRFDRFVVRPRRYRGQTLSIEADASTACYPLAFAALTGGYIRIANLDPRTRQPDIGFAGLLRRMGCRVGLDGGAVELWGAPRLRGGFEISMKEMSDQAMTLAAIAPFADAPITITGVAHIRTHECDRIAAICESLGKLGIRVDEREDGMTIHPGIPSAAVLPTYDDHRVAMSLALIGARVPGIRLLDPGCVSKTCPTFFDDMSRLGLQVRLHSVR